MGGPIAADAALTLKPYSAIFLCPVGLTAPTGILRHIFALPGIGKVLMGFASQILADKILSGLEGHSQEHADQIGKMVEDDVYIEALSRTLWEFPFADARDSYEQIAKEDGKYAVIWGRNDEVTPFEGLAALTAIFPSLTTFIVDEGGHDLPYNNHEIVSEVIISTMGKERP